MGFLLVEKRITKVMPRLEVTRSPSSYGFLPVPMPAQVGLMARLEVTRSLSSYGFLPFPVADAQPPSYRKGNVWGVMFWGEEQSAPL